MNKSSPFADLRAKKAKQDETSVVQIHSSAEFIANFVPPDYLIDGLLQRGFLYSMTGPTGEGKTSVLLLLAYMVAMGVPLGEREIDKGKVLFLAGENPDDTRMRWIKLLDVMKIDAADVDVFFIAGGFTMSAEANRKIITEYSKAYGPFALIIVDTSVVFYEGDDENNRIQMLAHAKMLRGLLSIIAGKPTLIVSIHPIKNFSRENMIPSGGGAFMNEVDGNLTCMKVDGTMVTEVHHCGKFRGIDFGPIPFRLEVGKTDKLKDSKGRHIWTVTACPMSDLERESAEDIGQQNMSKLLAVMAKFPGASIATLAVKTGWFYKDGKPNKSLAQRILIALLQNKLIKKEAGRWVLTKEGKKQADVPFNEDLPFDNDDGGI